MFGIVRHPRFVPAAILAAGALTATAQQEPTGKAGAAAEEKVNVTVLVIRATKSNTEVSPELKGLAEKLKREFKYTGYKLEKKETREVEIGKDWTAALTGKYRASITPAAREKGKVTMKISVSESGKQKQSATVTVPEGQYQLMGGWTFEGDDVLIVGFSAK